MRVGEMKTTLRLFKFVRDMVSATFKLEPEQMAIALPHMLDRMQNHPALKIAIQGMSLMGIKPEAINPKRKRIKG